MNIEQRLAQRATAIDASGIRRIFELGRSLKDPINLSIGQPDFPVPEPVKRAAVDAIEGNQNGYTLTQGIAELRQRLAATIAADAGWNIGAPDAPSSVMVTSGTSGALVLACMALLDVGDEMVIPDPYFVIYPALATMCGAKPVRCQTMPDGKMTAERVEPLLTDRTKIVLFNSPGNPTGAVASTDECAELLELCRSRNVLLISDEIYDEFTYSECRTEHPASASSSGSSGGGGGGDGASEPRCPSPARQPDAEQDMLLVRGFGKTYGVTGWRLGYAAGPTPLIEQMAKLQQYTFVCAPSMAQWGALAALETDISPMVREYEARRNTVVQALGDLTDMPTPGGAFYAFVRVPEHLGLTGTQFCERCIEHNVLVIPGAVFSQHDTHIRLSYAAPREKLEKGLEVLAQLMKR